MPVIPKAKDKDAVLAQCGAMRDALHAAGVRVKVDASEGRTPGWKFSFWEMKGVPVRLEVGPRDVKKEACVVCRRDRPGKEGKEFGVPVEARALVAAVRAALDAVQVRRFGPSSCMVVALHFVPLLHRSARLPRPLLWRASG